MDSGRALLSNQNPNRGHEALAVIVDVDVPPGFAEVLMGLGARVLGFSTLADVSKVDLVLFVTAGSPDMIRSARALFTPPILALIDDDAAGRPAVEAGADYVLPRHASVDLLTAVYLAALRSSRANRKSRALEAALQSVSDAVEVSDENAKLFFVNHAFERMTGYDSREVIGKTPAELLRSDVHDAHFYGEMWSTVSKGKTWSGSLVGRRKNGALVAQMATIHPISDETGSLRNVVAVKQFLPTEHLDTAPPATPSLEPSNEEVTASIAALANSERRYRMLVEAAGDAILVIDFDSGRVLEVNPAAVGMFGYLPAEFRLLAPRDLAPPEASAIVDRVSKALSDTGRALEPRHPFRRKDGTSFVATVRLSSFELMGRRQYLAIIRDVTSEVAREDEIQRSHRRLAEAQNQLLHSSRLAALGQMAAGVAHEINNPLQYILAGIDDIDPILRADPDKRQVLQDMREGAERIRTITRSLLPFARVDGAQTEPVDLNELALWATRVSANEIRHRAKLELHLASPPPTVIGHRSRLGELVTNLLVNAMEGIDDARPLGEKEHRIVVTTEYIDWLPPHANGDTSRRERRVRLIVEDTGAGIPEEHKARTFDPFFMTNARGKRAREGSAGLGLALCAEIVARHNGTIEVESTVGVGSRFIVTLSEAGANARRQPSTPIGPSPSPMPPARGIRVLVIDDEEALIRTYRRSLKGFHVVTASGGKAALEILASDLDFDAVLCDLMMPNVDGPMVYAHILSVAPELAKRILFCSGGAFTTRVREFLENIPNVVLDKPVSAAHLRAALEKLASSLPPPPKPPAKPDKE